MAVNSNYVQIRPQHLFNPAFVSLPDVTVKALALFAKCSSSATTEGLYRLGVVEIAGYLGLDEQEAREGMARLEPIGILWDDENEVVLDVEALRLKPLKLGRDKETGEVKPPDKNMISAARRLPHLTHSRLFVEFLEVARRHAPDFFQFLEEEGLAGSTPAPPQRDTTLHNPSRPSSSSTLLRPYRGSKGSKGLEAPSQEEDRQEGPTVSDAFLRKQAEDERRAQEIHAGKEASQ